MADTADAERMSGRRVGTILPFSWDGDLDLVVDPSLYDHDVIWFNAGQLGRSIALRSADHRRIAAPSEAAIAAPSPASLGRRRLAMRGPGRRDAWRRARRVDLRYRPLGRGPFGRRG